MKKGMFFELAAAVKERMERWKEWRRPNPKPFFPYQNLPDSERLKYELMTWDNCSIMLQLFENDPNPFVEKSLKSRPEFDNYLVDVLDYRYYSPKHGSCDWFLSLADGTYVGVLHLYDLNKEIFDGKHPAPFMGYAITESHRGKGFAEEAARHLIKHIPLIFRRYEVEAEPKKENEASRELLKKLGFIEQQDRREGNTSVWYKKLIDGDIPEAKWENY